MVYETYLLDKLFWIWPSKIHFKISSKIWKKSRYLLKDERIKNIYLQTTENLAIVKNKIMLSARKCIELKGITQSKVSCALSYMWNLGLNKTTKNTVSSSGGDTTAEREVDRKGRYKGSHESLILLKNSRYIVYMKI